MLYKYSASKRVYSNNIYVPVSLILSKQLTYMVFNRGQYLKEGSVKKRKYGVQFF